jgi:hypothetical protein
MRTPIAHLDRKVFAAMVIGGMLIGMATLAASLATELYDSWHHRAELNLELSDFDRLSANPNEKQRIEAQRKEPTARTDPASAND